MTTVDNIVPITVAATARARRRVYDHFMTWQALSPLTAIEFSPANALERGQFEALCKSGVIRAAAPGQYWLDLDRHETADTRRYRKLLPLLAGLVVLVVFGVMLWVRG